MASLEQLKKDSESWAREEIEQTGLPSIINFETSHTKGQELAEQYGADTDLVHIGCSLMDIKLGEAFKQKKPQEHIQMGVEATKEFLKNYDITPEQRGVILECVANHHAHDEFESIEAEVCANADCYRFICSENVFAFVCSLREQGKTFTEAIEFANTKLEEKQNILSLRAAREELSEEYIHFSALFKHLLA